jgi:hypothetical protein
MQGAMRLRTRVFVLFAPILVLYHIFDLHTYYLSSPESSSTYSRKAQTASIVAAPHKPVLHIWFYETTPNATHTQLLLKQLSGIPRIQASVFGAGQGFAGFGAKQAALLPLLSDATLGKSTLEGGGRSIHEEDIVVISDGRDVIMNVPATIVQIMSSDNSTANNVASAATADVAAWSEQLVEDFVQHYQQMTATRTNAIIISAEAQCCVNAMTTQPPGSFTHANNSRNARACSMMEGWKDCPRRDGKNVPATNQWHNWFAQQAEASTQVMRTTATANGTLSATSPPQPRLHDIYLNAGLMAGTARNLLRVIKQAQVGLTEDDQAVLSDYWYRNVDDIVLDYRQVLFGNTRHARGKLGPETCVFEVASKMRAAAADKNNGNGVEVVRSVVEEISFQSQQLMHTKTHSIPLFLHNPGKFFVCQTQMADKLGLSKL